MNLTLKTISDPYPPVALSDRLDTVWRRIYEALKPLAMAGEVTPNMVRRLMREQGSDAILEKLFGNGWQAGQDAVGGGGTAVVPTAAVHFLQEANIKLARSTSEEVNDLLRDTLAEALEQGVDGPQVTERVRVVLDDYGPMQAQRVAVTESTRAYGDGRVEGWRTSMVVKGKEWLLSADACALCRAIAAKGVIPVSQPFLALGETIMTEDGLAVNDYMAINAEPAHPHCRCVAAPVLDLGE